MSIVFYIFLLLGVNSCSVTNRPLHIAVEEFGFQKSVIQSSQFFHVLVSNNKPVTKTLFVYFGGDGTPWIGGNKIAKDPTPRNNLTLRLMSKNDHPAIFIGRPCYFGMVYQQQCTSDLWTNGRYSQIVLDSMEEALNKAIAHLTNTKLVFVGYSGGGAIATLLVERFPNAVALVTVAANLDTDMWTRIKGFLPLNESLNPRKMTLINKKLVTVHLIGELDTIVPNDVTLSFVKKHGGIVWRYPNYGHLCCWVDNWSKISAKISNTIENAL